MKVKSILRYFSKRKIGEGWDYVVFQSYTDKNKVIKILRPAWKHIWSRKMMPSRISEVLNNPMNEQMLETAKKLRKITLLNGNGKIFGQARFIGTTYTQDRLVTLRDCLKNCSEEKAKDLLKKFLELQKQSWALGIADMTFKFSGYGVTPDSEIVMLDLSRLTFSAEQIKMVISGRKWLSTLDARLLSPPLRYCFKEISDDLFEQNLAVFE